MSPFGTSFELKLRVQIDNCRHLSRSASSHQQAVLVVVVVTVFRSTAPVRIPTTAIVPHRLATNCYWNLAILAVSILPISSEEALMSMKLLSGLQHWVPKMFWFLSELRRDLDASDLPAVLAKRGNCRYPHPPLANLTVYMKVI
jgi:hypothetical protein